MRPWDSYLSSRDQQVFAAAGYGSRAGYGLRPAVLVVDVNYAFCGDKPEPILDSIVRWPNSCGPEAWTAIDHIATLLAVARTRDVPIIYTTGEDADRRAVPGRWGDKNWRATEDVTPVDREQIMPQIAPHTSDVVIRKDKPSAFFGTALIACLVGLGADTLLVTGTTTSGCVRATVVDGFSYNFKVAVVEECTFDRGQASHAIALFDLNAKYADVVALTDACHYLRSLPDTTKAGR